MQDESRASNNRTIAKLSEESTSSAASHDGICASPGHPDQEEDTPAVRMVTTRRQTRKRTSDGAEAVDGSSFLESPAPATTQSPTRQRKLPVRAKSGKNAVEKAETLEPSEEAPASPPADSSLVVEIRPRSASDEEGVLSVPDDEEPTLVGEKEPTPLPEIEEPSSQPNTTTFTGTKTTFDDENEIAEIEDGDDATGEKLVIAPSISEPSDDDSDSDEAPEAVSTSKAAAEAIQSAKAANKAIAE